MNDYVKQCLLKASALKDDEFIKRYKNKLWTRVKLANAFTVIYCFLVLVPFLINIPSFISSTLFSDLFSIGLLGVISVCTGVVFLYLGIMLKGGVSFYELPGLKQTLGRKKLSGNIRNYLNGLSGEKGLLLVDCVISDLTVLGFINGKNILLAELRIIEDCIVSRRTKVTPI